MKMLFTRLWLSLLLVLFVLNDVIQGQHEFRNAIKTKKNRKMNETKENVNYVRDKTQGAAQRTGTKINEKQKNAKRKYNAIKDVVNS